MLNRLFNNSDNDVYQSVAEELNGKFTLVPTKSAQRGRIDLPHNNTTITLDVFDSDNVDGRSQYTRLRMPFIGTNDFKFEVYRSDIFTTIAKWFGLQDLTIGDEKFNKEFIIRGNNQETVRQLLSDPKLKQLIQDQPAMILQIRDTNDTNNESLPKGVKMAFYKTGGVVHDAETLKCQFELFKSLSDQIIETGISRNEKPNFEL